jgi:hypothetical protein
MTIEALTPLDVERKLRALVNDLTRAQAELREARDAEVDAKHAWDRGRRRALLSGECPKVTRNGWTTSERDAWVDDQVGDLRFDYDRATVVREAAVDRLRVLMAQAELVRSLGSQRATSVRLRREGGLMPHSGQPRPRTPPRH